MTNMKQIYTLLLHYFSWCPVINWSIRIGFLFLAAGVLFNLSNNDYLAYKMISLAWNGIFVLPYMAIPFYFRMIISNKRLGLIPGFYFKTGMAMLVFTLLVSISLQVISTLLDLEGFVPGTALLFFTATFTVATVYFSYFQFVVTSKYAPALSAIGALIMCACVIYLISNGLPEAFTNKIEELLMAILVGWGIALWILFSRSQFKPGFNVLAGEKDNESFRSLWVSYDKHPEASTPEGTLLLGVPDSIRTLLMGGAMWILVFPSIVSLAFALFNLVLPGDAMPPVSWTFLGVSAFLGAWSTFSNSELVARMRLLWLRYGTDRNMLWNYMEKLILRSWLCIYIWAFCCAILFAILDMFDTSLLINYLIFIPVNSVFLLYVSILSRLKKWPAPLKLFSLIASICVPIILIFNALTTENYFLLNTAELLFIIAALSLRQLARNSFLGIDWYQVKLFRLSSANSG